jgi:transcriptional regulator with XRE-family HTH domain
MDQDRAKEVGLVLRQLRIVREMGQQETARKVGITRSMLSTYERGRVMPEMATLERILAVLRSTWADFERLRVVTRSLRLGRSSGTEPSTPPTEAMDGVLIAMQGWLESVRGEMKQQVETLLAPAPESTGEDTAPELPKNPI